MQDGLLPWRASSRILYREFEVMCQLHRDFSRVLAGRIHRGVLCAFQVLKRRVWGLVRLWASVFLWLVGRPGHDVGTLVVLGQRVRGGVGRAGERVGHPAG